MQDTIENYIRDINKIPELIEMEIKSSINKFLMQFLLELREYMLKNKMICRETKIEDCIVEKLKLSNEMNKKENEEVLEEYRQLFPKENINELSIFIEKYVEYISKKINTLSFNKAYLETPKILEKEIMNIIEKENYHNIFLISNYEKVKIFVSRLIDKCYKEYLEQIKLTSYQVGLGYFKNKSEMLKEDLKLNIKSVQNLEDNNLDIKLEKNVLPGDVLSDYDRKIENSSNTQTESHGEVLPGGLIL